MIDTIPEALSALHGSRDVNIDQAILEHRIAAAQEFARSCAVDPRGRREVVAREVRCRRAVAIPAANDDEKQAGDPVLDTLRHLRDNPKRKPNGRDHTPS